MKRIVAPGLALLILALSCEQGPGGGPGSGVSTALDGTYTPLEGEAPAEIPPGFVWVRGGTVGGSEEYRAVFTYPEGANFAGEEGIQYGAFVSGRVVTIPSFFIAKYEVTWERWKEVYDWAVSEERGENKYVIANPGFGSDTGEGRQRPVTAINWRDAIVWCNAASEKDGLEPVYYRMDGALHRESCNGGGINTPSDNAVMRRENNGYRLPTLCEGEYAARGGDPREPEWRHLYAGSDDPATVAWHYGTSGAGVGEAHRDYGLHPVGTKASNSLGIYDLSGNVMEWRWDWMHFAQNGKTPPMGSGTHNKLDPNTPEAGPAKSNRLSQKPMMGGNWHSSSPYALNALWWGFAPSYLDNTVGFRVARSGRP
jgi:formylglycine-generating enzyme required for sulfatase activity